MGDIIMNKKAYETPEIIARMIVTYNLAMNDISTGDDNEFSGGDVDWS